jgi:DNA-binding transcriptional MerR regulator
VPVFEEDDEALVHYGILRRSGRYPYGSGGNDSYTDAIAFQKELKELRALGMSNAEIAKSFGDPNYKTTQLRSDITVSGIIIKQRQIQQANKLADSGMGPSAIAKEMFGSSSKESTVRGLLEERAGRKKDQLERLADALRTRVKESEGYIDVGKGVHHHFGVKKDKLDVALAMLKSEGYVVETVLGPQATTPHNTRYKVLAKPGETWSSIKNNLSKLQPAQIFKGDDDRPKIVQEPLQLNPARLDIKYKDQGGEDADGVIYVRPGVKDLDMGGSAYAQVRIQVGKNHYIKGMAVMKEGLPPGVDLQFHTNKKDTGNKLDALKPVSKSADPMERFGAIYSQVLYPPGHPKAGKVMSHMNKVNDQDDWDDWSKSLATQMLSKQRPDFVKRQLDVTYAQKKAQLDEIMALTNPVVKKELLKAYADDMDASSVHLKAASLPRQKTHVILPINSLKDDEVYAPRMNDGERVVLIRYPHGGKFEIPELRVNNRNREARKILDPAKTTAAIGINAKVAKRLSGADFDGDTVVLIPNRRGRIQSESPLQKLKDFEPHEEYRGSKGLDKDGKHIPLPGVKLMKNTQTEMGKISNLITDMTIAGASHDKIARAVRHSMVVIDAEKHGLDHNRSYRENAILALKKEYQPGRSHGAATIISRTSGEQTIPEVKRRPQAEGGGTNPRTGEPIFVPTGNVKPRPIKDDTGNVVGWEKVPKTMKVERGTRIPGTSVTDPVTGRKIPIRDAFDLVSGSERTPRALRGTPVERHYADYSNRVRNLANEARKADLSIKEPRVNKSAKEVYSKEVASLQSKLKVAQANSPKERQAQVIANSIIRMKRNAEPTMSKDTLKRVKTNAIREARDRVGAKPQRIDITPREWEAIQNHAVASHTLREILTKADIDKVREYAQPKDPKLLMDSKKTLALALLNNGNYTRAEVAEQLGVSVATLDRALR